MAIKNVRRLTFITTISLALLYAAIITSQNSLDTTKHNAFAQEVFIASNMTGAKEVPPVNSMASGTATLVNNQTFIDYDLSVSDLYNATSAHIHQGKAGVNGPIVVTLYKTADPSPGLFGGYSGNITSSMLEGPLKGQQLSALVDLMSNGQAYVNVHTIKNKNGEIRDQLTLSSGNSTGIT
ncbi:MAG TPA: CHRD domain-containing protein [Nitrososphaeraceae archaeon]